MNLEERIDAALLSIDLTNFRWRKGDGEAPEGDFDVTEAHKMLKQLLRDVVVEIMKTPSYQAFGTYGWSGIEEKLGGESVVFYGELEKKIEELGV